MAPCKHVVLAKYTSEFVCEENFELVEEEIADGLKANSGDILLKNLFLSVDPWSRLCMHSTTQGLYVPPFEIGKAIPVLVVSEVIASENSKYQVGEYVTGLGTASEFSLIPGGKDGFGYEFRKLDCKDSSLQQHLSILGLPGLTAWVGIVKIGQAKPRDEVFISAASGGVGLAAGQLAKVKGCRVIGSAGTDEKVQMLKEEFGFDDAFNYKTETDWNATLGRLFPNGIDIYFENVGGKMLEAVLNHINYHARIAISGMISQYNKDWKDAEGIRNLMNLVGRCAKMEGFLALDNASQFEDFINDMLPQIIKGKIHSRETVTKGLENFSRAFVGMMRGENAGKSLVQLF